MNLHLAYETLAFLWGPQEHRMPPTLPSSCSNRGSHRPQRLATHPEWSQCFSRSLYLTCSGDQARRISWTTRGSLVHRIPLFHPNLCQSEMRPPYSHRTSFGTRPTSSQRGTSAMVIVVVIIPMNFRRGKLFRAWL